MSQNMHSKILFEKDGFCMVKENSNRFKISFLIENTKMYLENIINVDLVKLVYDLNPDIFETIKFTKNNNNPNEATVYFIMKHFFEDLGMPQFYNNTHVTKCMRDQYIIFKIRPMPKEENEENEEKNKYCELIQMPMEEMEIICYKMTEHKISFQYNICFNKKHEIPPYVEKLVGNIVYKIFNRVKLFIENVNI